MGSSHIKKVPERGLHTVTVFYEYPSVKLLYYCAKANRHNLFNFSKGNINFPQLPAGIRFDSLC